MGVGVASGLLLAAVATTSLGPIPGPHISVCTGKTCRKDGSRGVLFRLQQLASEVGAFAIEECGCLGECGKGPNVLSFRDSARPPKRYGDVRKPETIAAIVEIELGVEVPDALVELQSLAVRAQKLAAQGKLADSEETFAEGVRRASAYSSVRAELQAGLDLVRQRASPAPDYDSELTD